MGQSSDLFPPPVSFYFSVAFIIPFRSLIEIPFMEVSGLTTEMTTEELKEGGENSFSYQLPLRIKHGNLILKRPIENRLMDLLEAWSSSSLHGELVTNVVPMDVSVSLIDAYKLPHRMWYITNAYPVKWDSGPFASGKNELAMETLELAYNKILRIL